MTLEQENDYKFFTLAITNDNSYKHLTELESLLINELGRSAFYLTFEKFKSFGYLHKTTKPVEADEITFSGMDKNIYAVSTEGLNYFQLLLNERKRENLQDRQSISNIETNESVKATNQSVSETNNSVQTTNRISNINAGLTLLMGIIILIIQISTCSRDKLKYHQEERRLIQDSLKRLQETANDSMLYNLLQYKVAKKDSSKK